MMKHFSPHLRPGKRGLCVSHGLGMQPDAATQAARAPAYGRFLQRISSPQLLKGQTERWATACVLVGRTGLHGFRQGRCSLWKANAF